MKKLMTMLVMLVAAMTMSAQVGGVKITPKYQKGDNMLYRGASTIDANGQTVKMNVETRYRVTEASANGYTIESTVEKVDVEAQDIMARLMSMVQGLLKGATVVLTTDADGRVTGIKNYEEVKAQGEKTVEEMLKTLQAEFPEMSQMLPADMLKAQMAESLTEEKILAMMERSPSPVSLNGKTIATGMMEESVNEDGQKVKNMYFLGSPDGKQVKVTTTLNMSKEDMKKMIIEQVKKLAPDQAEMIEQNIDMVLQSGQLKIELNQTADYTFGDNGWLKTLTVDQKQNTMGQATSGVTKLELVESNR